MADDYYLDSVSDNPEYFRNRLLELDSHIDSDILTDLKFLLRDYVPGGSLERVDCARDLFSYLEKMGHLSDENRSLLVECLWRVGLGGYLYLLDEDPRCVQQQIEVFGSSRLSRFRILQFRLASELNYEDVKRLLYQLNVKKAKADAIMTGTDLFVHLEKQGLVGPDNLDVISNAFDVLGRMDLREMVDAYFQETAMLQGPSSDPPSYSVSQPPSYRYEPPSFGTTHGPSKGSNPTRRGNSVPPVVNPSHHEAKGGNIMSGGLGQTSELPGEALAGEWKSSLKSLHPNKPSMQPLTSLRSNPDSSVQDPGMEENQPMSLREAQVSAPTERVSEVNDSQSAEARETTEVASNIVPVPDDLDEYYSMKRNPRGMCVIINNENFQTPPPSGELLNLSKRVGSEVDAAQLEKIWTKLHFQVMRKNDLTADAMVQTLIEVAYNTNQSQFDCFVCCILSHGIKDYVYGADSVPVQIQELLAPFKPFNCPPLRGKPKLFFIQACQGKDRQIGVDIDEDSPYAEGSNQDPNMRQRTPEMIPNESDFLLGYATVPGYVSYRSRSSGSWYITKLVQMLEKYGNRKDLLTILTLVNREVGQANAIFPNGPFKQSPAPFFTLRKKVQFFPLQPPSLPLQ